MWDGDEPDRRLPDVHLRRRGRAASFLGSQDVTDEQVPTAVPGREAEALAFFTQWAFTDGGFDRIRFHSVLEGNRWLDVVDEVARSTDCIRHASRSTSRR